MKIEMGIGWMPDGPGHLRSATPNEYAAEIQHLREAASRLLAAMDRMLDKGETFTARVSLAAEHMRQAIQ